MSSNAGFVMEAWPSSGKPAHIGTTQPYPATMETGFQLPPPSYPGTSANSAAIPAMNNVPVITQPAVGSYMYSVPPSYTGHIVIAVFALVAAFPFGLAALILAIVAQNRVRSVSDVDGHHSVQQFATASLGLSVSGLIICGVAIIVAVTVSVTTANALTSATFSSSAGGSSGGGSGGGINYDGSSGSNSGGQLPPYTITTPTTTTTTTLCPNYFNSFCYPYMITWNGGADDCRFGFLASDQSSCYYDQRYDVSNGATCTADLDLETNYCYYTSTSMCSYAENYHNGICYPAYLSGSVLSCLHGYYYSPKGLCYYDSFYSSTDSTCDGQKADRGSTGLCYYSSSSACIYATNFVNSYCYAYVFVYDSSNCVGGVYTTTGLCLYKYASNIGSGFSSTFSCNPFTSNHIGDYCYSN